DLAEQRLVAVDLAVPARDGESAAAEELEAGATRQGGCLLEDMFRRRFAGGVGGGEEGFGEGADGKRVGRSECPALLQSRGGPDAGHAPARRTGPGGPVGTSGAGGTAGAGRAVDAGGPAHPAVQLQLALPAVRSNTHRNSAPQRLHGFPASAGMDREFKLTFCAQPGHNQPGCHAAMPASYGRPLHLTIYEMHEIDTCRAANCSNPVAAQEGNTWRRAAGVQALRQRHTMAEAQRPQRGIIWSRPTGGRATSMAAKGHRELETGPPEQPLAGGGARGEPELTESGDCGARAARSGVAEREARDIAAAVDLPEAKEKVCLDACGWPEGAAALVHKARDQELPTCRRSGF
ncbi:unnamed protein product, partial [Symbiodinium sp. CCMP2456]